MKIEDKFLKGEYVNNGADKLIIVTTGNPVGSLVQPTLEKLYRCSEDEKDAITQELKEKLGRYNYFKYSTNTSCDYLYLLDFYDGFYGFFYNDGENYILDDVVSQLDEFIIKNNYKKENVTIFGSSKGGYAAMLLGNECTHIGNVIGLIPDINLQRYNNRHDSPNLLVRKISDTLFGSPARVANTMKVATKLEDIGSGKVDSSKNQLYILGRHDLTFFKPAFEMLNKKNNFNILIIEHVYGHGAVSSFEQVSIKEIVHKFPILNVEKLPYTYMRNTELVQTGRDFLDFEYINNDADKLVIFTEHLCNRKIIDNFISKSSKYNYLIVNDRTNQLCGFNFIEGDEDILKYLVRQLDSLILREKIAAENIVIVGFGAASIKARLISKQSIYIKKTINLNPELNIRKYTANKENYSSLKEILYGNENKTKITNKYNRQLNSFNDEEWFLYKTISKEHKINKKQVDKKQVIEYAGLVSTRVELIDESIKLAFNAKSKLRKD